MRRSMRRGCLSAVDADVAEALAKSYLVMVSGT
jgi:hypothetical protein